MSESLRFLILNMDYPDFLRWLYAKQPGLERQLYEEKMLVNLDNLISVSGSYSRDVHKVGAGYRTFALTMSSAGKRGQGKWALG